MQIDLSRIMSKTAFKTKQSLPIETRTKMAALLNEGLASTVHLGLQAKQCHWNVKGPLFFQLHELFDKVYDEAAEWADVIAERVVQLGVLADSRLEVLQKNTKLPTHPADLHKDTQVADAFAKSLAALSEMLRHSVGHAEEAGDAATADLFTEVLRGADKMLWFVESHLQSD